MCEPLIDARIPCSQCGKSVSTPVPAGTLVRAFVECPECIEKGIQAPDAERRIAWEAARAGWLKGYEMVTTLNLVKHAEQFATAYVAARWPAGPETIEDVLVLDVALHMARAGSPDERKPE